MNIHPRCIFGENFFLSRSPASLLLYKLTNARLRFSHAGCRGCSSYGKKPARARMTRAGSFRLCKIHGSKSTGF